MAKSVDKVYGNTQSNGTVSGGSTKKLPIVVCLDVSPSMYNYNRYQRQNIALQEFLMRIAQVYKVWATAEIAFVTFADDIIMKTEFMPLGDMRFPAGVATREVTVIQMVDSRACERTITVPFFEPLDRETCTELPRAVGRAHKMLCDRMSGIKKSKYSHYAPFLVVVTDGNPDSQDYQEWEAAGYRDEEENVSYKLKRWCDKLQPLDHLILPFFIGIGSEGVDFTGLRRLAANLPGGLFIVEDDGEDSVSELGRVFSVIAATISKSTNYNTTSELIRAVEKDISAAKKKLNTGSGDSYNG